MNARYYNSETGQFISKDTYLGEAYSSWTQNLYSYTGNNPVNYVDPTRHSFVAVATIVGIAVGASIGAYRSYKKTGKVSVKSVIKGGIIGGAAGFALGGVIAAGTTGSILAPTAKVLAGAKTIVGAGSIGAGISAIADNFKAAGSEIVNWAGNVFSGGKNNSVTNVHGKPHGSPAHQARISELSNKLINSGKYSDIYLNKSLNTAGLNGNMRPDLIAKTNNGMYQIWEFASKSQASGSKLIELNQKLVQMQVLNPAAKVEKLIPW